jgi:tryptophan 2,3-dioxygenase
MPFGPSPKPPKSPGGGLTVTQPLLIQDPSNNSASPKSEGCEQVSLPPGEPEGAWDFWNDYKKAYTNSLAEAEKDNLNVFDEVFFQQRESHYTFSAKANRAALFIMLYRGYPMLQAPFQLLNNLLEIDEQLSTWRHRHMNMVHRMIGTRIGTGGSSGKDYLKAAADKHYIFKEIAQLTSFLIERRKLPQLPKKIEEKLGFAGPGPLK